MAQGIPSIPKTGSRTRNLAQAGFDVVEQSDRQ